MDSDVGIGSEDGDEVQVKKGRGCLPWIIVLIVLLGGAGATAFLMGTIITREETPLPGEEFITDIGLRTIAVPGEFQNKRIPKTQAVSVAKGKDLFSGECAQCHGAGGKGDAELGRTMYPPAVDLTKNRTQSKTDGQLYWLIAHGVNLTGMPAWGKDYGGPNNDDEIWSMVAYIRTLK